MYYKFTQSCRIVTILLEVVLDHETHKGKEGLVGLARRGFIFLFRTMGTRPHGEDDHISDNHKAVTKEVQSGETSPG